MHDRPAKMLKQVQHDEWGSLHGERQGPHGGIVARQPNIGEAPKQ